jgi:hypothetical protein
MIHKFRYLAAMNLYAITFISIIGYNIDKLAEHRTNVRQWHYDTPFGHLLLRLWTSMQISQIISTGGREST